MWANKQPTEHRRSAKQQPSDLALHRQSRPGTVQTRRALGPAEDQALLRPWKAVRDHERGTALITAANFALD